MGQGRRRSKGKSRSEGVGRRGLIGRLSLSLDHVKVLRSSGFVGLSVCQRYCISSELAGCRIRTSVPELGSSRCLPTRSATATTVGRLMDADDLADGLAHEIEGASSSARLPIDARRNRRL